MKYYNKFLSILLTVIASVYTAKAQTKPFSIGTQMPDITFTKTINFPTSNVKISDFKGKLIILDFWATWCSPCVAAIPKIDSLQKKFKDSVVFLPVTYQDKTIVSPFANRVSKNDKIEFHSILSDTVLNKMFPHTSIPFFVWVDKNGKIIASTDATQINVSDIRKILQGNINITNRKMRDYRAVDVKRPVIVPSVAYLDGHDKDKMDLKPLDSQQVVYQSILTKYDSNLRGKAHYDSVHFVEINSPIINFYRMYYGAAIYKKYPFIFWSASRCKVEVSDSTLYNKITSSKKGADYLKWSEKNAYCYELKWDNCKTWEEKFALLKSDIDRYFGKPLAITAVIEKRLVPSDVLIKIANNKSLTVNNTTPSEENDAFLYSQKGKPLSAFIERLQGYYWQTSDRPVFDETGLTGNYNIKLQCNMNDIDQVNIQLEKYGLKFVTEDRIAEVLVIRKAEK